jgi:hypothetical protein
MANHLFSQIPPQVLNKVNICKLSDGSKVTPRKKVKFEITHSRHDDSSTDLENDIVDIEDDSNESTSSLVPPPQKSESRKQYSDAVIQTSAVERRSIATQTDESLITRPLNMSENDMHRQNMQSFAPITPIYKNRSGREPPLRIGLTLRGKKRKVFYPDDDGAPDGA